MRKKKKNKKERKSEKNEKYLTKPVSCRKLNPGG